MQSILNNLAANINNSRQGGLLTELNEDSEIEYEIEEGFEEDND